MFARTTGLILLTGCAAEGEWALQTWGEDYIEEEIPAPDFADGCTAAFDSFQIVLADKGLVDGNGALVAQLGAAELFDVHLPGPHRVGSAPAPVGLYPTVQARIAPSDALIPGNLEPGAEVEMIERGWSIYAEGTVSCDIGTVGFGWGFETDTTYVCAPDGLDLARGSAALSELTIHGDHLFYDGLEDPEAGVRGEAIVNADADRDGWVTLEELEAIEIAPLGYTVGQFGEVRDLRQFVTHLTTTLGHIDGEGHCTTVRGG